MSWLPLCSFLSTHTWLLPISLSTTTTISNPIFPVSQSSPEIFCSRNSTLSRTIACSLLISCLYYRARHLCSLPRVGAGEPIVPAPSTCSRGLSSCIFSTNPAHSDGISDQTQISKPKQFASISYNQDHWQRRGGILGFTCPASSKATAITISIFPQTGQANEGIFKQCQNITTLLLCLRIGFVSS